MHNPTHTTIEDVLYPAGKPYRKGWLEVGDGHALFYQEYGNPKGPAALVVHGGPGGAIPEGSRSTRTHDPSHFRIICVDQRGCGGSRPHVAVDRKAALYKNNPDALVEDFEKLRNYLAIDSWHVSGYSWGSCLATLYATRHPQRCLSLVIGGVWMHTPEEIDWYFNRMDLFVPEAADKLLAVLPAKTDRNNRMPTLARIITGKDHKLAVKVAGALGSFESYATFFDPANEGTISAALSPAARRMEETRLVSLGALECYFMYKSPLEAGWYSSKQAQKALNSIARFEIVQSRYDIVCPPLMAYELHKAYPHSTLTMVQFAGHTFREPEITRHYIRALDRLKFS